jgi:hypothetical protein
MTAPRIAAVRVAKIATMGSQPARPYTISSVGTETDPSGDDGAAPTAVAETNIARAEIRARMFTGYRDNPIRPSSPLPG